MYSPTTEAGEIQDVAHGMPSLQEWFETSKKKTWNHGIPGEDSEENPARNTKIRWTFRWEFLDLIFGVVEGGECGNLGICNL